MSVFPNYREIFLEERCEATHAAIKGGRTALPPIGYQDTGRERKLLLVNCPYCGTTISVTHQR